MVTMLDPKSLSASSIQESLDLSLVIPIYNEYESIPKLLQVIAKVMEPLDYSYEVICVDDGSTDGSVEVLRQQTTENDHLAVLLLRRNYGQTAAMAAGFDYARGEVIITLDGDLQNDPTDIPMLMNKLDEGYDLVSGWRKHRQDHQITRLLPSKIANWIIARVTGVSIHDYGCSLKAYRSELVRDMNLYGELHRFLPALAFIEGARITEVPVNHQARQFGASKYGLGRTFRVVRDLLTGYFMKKFLSKPMYVFGLMGLLSMISGTLLGGYLTFLKLALGQSIGDRPLLILAIVLLLAGIQLLCFGLLAELLMRTYHESQNRPIYRVREVLR